MSTRLGGPCRCRSPPLKAPRERLFRKYWRIPMRPSRRAPDELRAVSLERGVVKYAEGSCMVKFGDTHVLVTATLEDRFPAWLKGQGSGGVTAEYGMLPRATLERTRREASAGKQTGRTVEIQRLIGRSLRAVVDLVALGERQITIDCDVIQADGGTRTAGITGAWVARQSCNATHAPLMAGARGPPAGWITSQSVVICRSRSASRSTTARRLRPISRWISTVRPPCLPAVASRRVRSRVARGSMPYSAVIQPRAWPLSHGGKRSSSVAVTSTWVSPNFTKHEPSAYFTTPRSSETARSSSGCRRLRRIGTSPWGRVAGRAPLLDHFRAKWIPVCGRKRIKTHAPGVIRARRTGTAAAQLELHAPKGQFCGPGRMAPASTRVPACPRTFRSDRARSAS